MIKAFAKYRYARSSPQKLRLIANIIRKKTVLYALSILKFSNKKSSFLILKVLSSAIANAKYNLNIDVDKLFIYNILIDAGPNMKRIIPRAKGRSDQIIKRTSHISIFLSIIDYLNNKRKKNGTKSSSKSY